MKEIEIIEIPLSSAPALDKVCVELRDERYFIAYENDHSNRNSILFKDLEWIRKHFSVDRTESSIITFDSLNDGRRNEIATYQKCIDLNVPIRELSYYDDEKQEWKMVETLSYNQYDREIKSMVRYKPDYLRDTNVFQERIDLGLLVLCKYV